MKQMSMPRPTWGQRLQAALWGIKGGWYDGAQSFNTASDSLYNFFGQSTYAGKNVDSGVAMQQATWFTCTRIITETIGSLPGGIFEWQKDGGVKRVEHDLGAVLFDSPNSDMDMVEFIEAGTTNLSGQGNAYFLRNDRSQGVSSLYPIPSPQVLPKRESDGRIWYNVNDRGKWTPYPRDKIWHVKGFGGDGLVGYSAIGHLRQMVGMALATEEWQARFFANGAMPSWFMSIPKFLDKETRKTARESLMDVFAGPQNAYKPQLLEGGITATPATMPLEDAQFMQLRGMTRDDIFGTFRVPPHMGGNLERSTNNNIEQQALEFVMYCIMPYLTRYEKSAGRWLFSPKDRGRFFVRWNVEGLLRADSAARGELYSKLLQNGVYNRNEVRQLENRNRVDLPGMDDYTVQTALVPIDMLRKVAERQAEKPTPVQVTAPPKGDTNVSFTTLLRPADVHATFEVPANKATPVLIENVLPTADGVVEALERFSSVVKELRVSMDAGTEVLKDAEGNIIGTKKVLRDEG